MKLFSRGALLIAALLAAPALAHAQTNTGWGKITSLNGGWSAPAFRVTLALDNNAPFYNPSGCSLNDGYVVDSSLPANQLLSSMLITAYSLGHPVMLTVSGCSLNRPSVVGVAVQPTPPPGQ